MSMIVHVERVGGITTSAQRIGGDLSVTAERTGGIRCRMFKEVRSSVGGPYLEITPEVIWVLAGWSTDNDVYSNTSWHVG